ncbi:DEAD/DEAH box helicase [Planococcus salinus]|uniref:DEAD/DEAH box helicase n=1 Tax=Planococcus salinus TaxID=1848460 RepID=UPI0030846DB8
MPSIPHSFVWNGILTPSQKQASLEVSASVSSKAPHLVYAVCGAGKTEMLFPAIFKALRSGKRICIAAPRIDVVLELSPRIRSVFPETIVHTLYGGSPVESGFASIIIATTHQLYRFQSAFDVMIVDEADAFPYSFDAALQRAVKKAMKKDAAVVYVSATPSVELLKNTSNQSRLFRRYHGYPLPVPRYKALWSYKKTFARQKIPDQLKTWVIQKIEQKKPFLLFFPSIELIEAAIPLFRKVHHSIEAVHAEDPLRKEKVMKLREKQIPGILTSTILERGVTISDVQVAVVGADERIFDSSALIQIAGRVGRSADYPTGEVTFFHNGLSKEMDKARKLIVSYNKGGQG